MLKISAKPDTGRRHAMTRLAEAGLWLVACYCLGTLAVNTWQAKQTMYAAESVGAFHSQSSGSSIHLATNTKTASGDSVVMGRIEIPMVGLNVPMMADYDTADLKRGVGHIPGTAMPGGLGNLGLAGHRDTYFRPLRNIHLGMEIDVVTAQGKYRYQIDSTEVVTPEQVEVLDIRSRPELTLITCYPFNYIGAAPKRFIVHAHLLSLEPS